MTDHCHHKLPSPNPKFCLTMNFSKDYYECRNELQTQTDVFKVKDLGHPSKYFCHGVAQSSNRVQRKVWFGTITAILGYVFITVKLHKQHQCSTTMENRLSQTDRVLKVLRDDNSIQRKFRFLKSIEKVFNAIS